MVIGEGYADRFMGRGEVSTILAEFLGQINLDGKRVLVIIPDSTRTAPIPMFFRLLREQFAGRVEALDFLIALGTHQPMDEDAINRLVGVTAEERRTTFSHTNIFNHEWQKAETFKTVGEITAAEVEKLTGGMLSQGAAVTVNRMVFDTDQVFVLGPVFPHEVVGFSAGTKYFFPGISGPEVINLTHWVGALATILGTIGLRETPVRAVIDRAYEMVGVDALFLNMVVTHHGLAGLYCGSYEEAWPEAVELSAKLHIKTVDEPYQRVLSIMPEMYDDIWTAAKGMYKMEPVIAVGGEVVIYAPHIDEISYTHGKILDEIGYHVRDYFVKQWDRFKGYPWGVLAHSTHLRGGGSYDSETGVETPNITVTLATGIPKDRCERLNLGYMDPAEIDIGEWEGREDQGVLVVHRAGETLYRLKED
ncbi:MAG: DUF2088 domain-containing protein [Anaerolineae bacterium]|nr:DUF2088 domain-containing protein [Anaerolineae bacterium]